jgi:hypothetical protein
MSASFDRSGLELSSGTVKVGMSLRAVSFGTALVAVRDATPSVEANRVNYAHTYVSEWYLNGPLGIEQGFTIRRAPSAHPTGPVALSMVLSGNVHALLSPDGQSITFGDGRARSLRYGDLMATDGTGRALHSWLALRAGGIVLEIDTTGARYPLRIDPLVQQGAKLTGSGEIGPAQLGYSVALSSDGNTALIGGPFDSGNSGAAWVFTRSGLTWTQQGAKLTGGGEIGAGLFGDRVALSSDGTTALIGGPGDDRGVGAAWVFTRSGSTWAQAGEKLTGAGEAFGRIFGGSFGDGVTLSADGDTALIGGFLDNERIGAAWVFTRSGSTWTQQGSKLTGAGEAGQGQFGVSGALSADGNTALIGGDADGGVVGAAWVFTRSGSTWTQQGEKLRGVGETGEGVFGESVALASDGNTALIGGPEDRSGRGAAWVFTRSGSTWTQLGRKLTGTGGAGLFGGSVALSSDGKTALIGAAARFGRPGAAWLFVRSASTWSQQGEMLRGGGESGNGQFGDSVAVSSDGKSALIGGQEDSGRAGAAWVFMDTPPGPKRLTKAQSLARAIKNCQRIHNAAKRAKCVVAANHAQRKKTASKRR